MDPLAKLVALLSNLASSDSVALHGGEEDNEGFSLTSRALTGEELSLVSSTLIGNISQASFDEVGDGKWAQEWLAQVKNAQSLGGSANLDTDIHG